MALTSSVSVIQLRYCAPGAGAAPEARPEDRKQPAERPSLPAEDDPTAQEHGADTGVGRRPGLRLPRTAH